MASPMFLSQLVLTAGDGTVLKSMTKQQKKNPNTDCSEKPSHTRIVKTFTALHIYSSAPLHCL